MSLRNRVPSDELVAVQVASSVQFKLDPQGPGTLGHWQMAVGRVIAEALVTAATCLLGSAEWQQSTACIKCTQWHISTPTF